jgi:hypothetical protein
MNLMLKSEEIKTKNFCFITKGCTPEIPANTDTSEEECDCDYDGGYYW